MAVGYRPVDRDQSFLLPPDVREWLSEDHVVWFVLDSVRQMDTSAFHEGYVVSGVGRRAYDPDMLLGLLIYAYSQGQRSSRAIERLCEVDAAFKVACALDVPDHCTISRFVRRHQGAVVDLFTQVLRLCAVAGLGRLGVVAVDGTKIAADASMAATRDEKWLRAAAVAAVEEQVACDRAEDEVFGENTRGDQLPEPLRRRGSRAARIAECLQQIEDEQAAQEKETADREAAQQQRDRQRAERRLTEITERHEQAVSKYQRRWDEHQQARRNWEAGQAELPRGRAAVPPHEHSVVVRLATAITEVSQALAGERPLPTLGVKSRKGQRRGQRSPRNTNRNVTDPDSRLMPTRKGFIQGFNAQTAVADDGLIVAVALGNQPADVEQLVPMMEQIGAAAAGPLAGSAPVGAVVADAGYFSDTNLTAPGPDRLIAYGKGSELAEQARTSPAAGPPPEQASPGEAMRHRMRTPEGLTTYRRRAPLAEQANARLKDEHGLRRFRRRGRDAVTAELTFTAAVANLLLLHRRAATG